jgi:hypothetical protein
MNNIAPFGSTIIILEKRLEAILWWRFEVSSTSWPRKVKPTPPTE